MDKDGRIELLHKFFRQILLTATKSLDSIDMPKLGIPGGARGRSATWDLRFGI
jgi:hypothetical protein